MKITLNGETMEMCKPLTIVELLKERNVESPDMVSVELNEQILSKDQFSNTQLKENDNVEFLYFMGGGEGQYERHKSLL